MQALHALPACAEPTYNVTSMTRHTSRNIISLAGSLPGQPTRSTPGHPTRSEWRDTLPADLTARMADAVADVRLVVYALRRPPD
jgi:hypothetical protein